MTEYSDSVDRQLREKLPNCQNITKLAPREASELALIFAHIFTPLPTEIRVEGKGYILSGKRKAWVYGKGLQLKWGEMCVRTCEDKWVFIFEVIPDVG